MAVDLSELVDSLRREIEVPGASDNLTALTDAQLTGYLSDSFWEAVLDGVIEGFTESDGIVTATAGSANLGRELQQLVVFYAGFRVIRNQMRDIQTLFRAKAGPTEYEVQQSASLLKAIMDELTRKRNIVLQRLSDMHRVTPQVVDAVVARSDSIQLGGTWWVGHGNF